MDNDRKALGRYLWHRPGSKHIWFRMAVPQRYRHVAQVAKVQQSLETSNLAEAKRRRDDLKAEYLSGWRQLAGEPPLARVEAPEPSIVPSRAELEDAAVAIGHEVQLEDAEARRRSLSSFGEWGYDLAAELAVLEHQAQARANARGNLSHVEHLADEVIEAMNFRVPKGGTEYRFLCEAISRVRFSATTLELERAKGDLEAESSSRLVAKVLERRSNDAAHGESLIDLFERWADDCLRSGRKREDTVVQDRKIIDKFSDFVGRKRAIESITPRDVADFRDTLKDLPPKWMSKRELRGLSMREAADKARSLGYPRMTLTNVNKHLSTISPLYT